MNPLRNQCYSPITFKAWRKLKNFAASGYNLIQKLHPNPEAMRFLDKRGFIDKGFPYFGWLVAIQSAVIRTALNFNLSFNIYGEDGEVEYGGSTETKYNSLMSIEYQKKIWFESGYDQIIDQIQDNLKKILFLGISSEEEIGKKKLYTTTWSYFENWDPYRNYITAKNHCGLKEADEGNESTFTNFAQTDQTLYALHMYLCFLKFGFGRALQDAGIESKKRFHES